MASSHLDLVWLMTLKFRNETIKMTSWPTDLTIRFQDTLVENDERPVDHVFLRESGITDVTFGSPGANALPRSELVVDFIDVNRQWSNRFDTGHNIVRVGLWTSSHTQNSNGEAVFSHPETRFKGKCRQASDVPGGGALYVRARFIGALQQVATVSPVRLTPSQQKALDPRDVPPEQKDNSMDYIARVAHMRWGGKP